MPGVEASQASDELERRLNEVDALRRRVLNVIPHALRTPITTFRGLAEALEHATEDEIRAQIGPALKRLAAQAENLLDDMLLAAGLTTTLPTGEPVATPVVATVMHVWNDVCDANRAKRSNGANGSPLQVEGDDAAVLAPAGSLAKILVHLLDNAAKYGDGTPVVRIERDGERVRLAVESPGPAVNDDVRTLVEPFFRGERAVMASAGLGVGLTVASALAVHAGGSLTVGARDGGGLIVTVELAAA